ncbi:DVU_1555 family C-GCAxxG-C-C protein [Acetobacterium sp.]|uniref:DVU_1555 family C-GCAxxG-C-C protein n=1 Tax=Acetobacterium sp. TaxID=1872094 RepID=UPI002F405F4D
MDETAYRILQLSMGGYCCTQIMLKMALEDEEKENPDLIRAVNGLCNGIGNDQKTCGVIIGGIGILGLYAGKGELREYPKEGYSAMITEYMEWFEESFGNTDCIDLIGVTKFTDVNSDQSYMVKCGEHLANSYQKIQEILTEHGYEFGSREE